MQFTPQQMAGYKGYSPGVLIGNWSEDVQVMEDKMKLYERMKAGTMNGATNAYALGALMTEPASIGPAMNGGFVPFGVPLMIQSVATGCVLALDVTPKYSPRLNHVFVSFAPQSSAKPMARNVWTLHRVADENTDFYKAKGEDMVVHYGQKLKVVNENVGHSGFYSLVSSLQDRARSSGRQELSACLGGGNMTVFTVEPANAPRGSKDGIPVATADEFVLSHKGSNGPVACEATHRSSTSFGSEFEASCGMVKSQQTRAQSMVSTQPANFMTFRLLPPGTKWSAPVRLQVVDALTRVKAKILQRGGRTGIRGVSAILRSMSRDGNLTLTRTEFRNGLEAFGVVLDSAELDAVFKSFDRDGDGTVSVTEFVRTIRGDMNTRRTEIVQRAFDQLNKDGQGDVEVRELLEVFRGNMQHSQASSGSQSNGELAKQIEELLDSFGGSGGRVTRQAFIEHYANLSAGIEDDDYFELMLRNAWHISGGEGWCENTTALRVLVIFNDDTQKVVEIRDDLGLKAGDMKAIRARLEAQGVANIKEVHLTG